MRFAVLLCSLAIGLVVDCTFVRSTLLRDVSNYKIAPHNPANAGSIHHHDLLVRNSANAGSIHHDLLVRNSANAGSSHHHDLLVRNSSLRSYGSDPTELTLPSPRGPGQCVFITDIIRAITTTAIPLFNLIGYILTFAVALPSFLLKIIIQSLFSIVGLSSVSDSIANELARCFRSSSSQEIYGENPLAAATRFSEGIVGEIHFAQTLAREDSPTSLSVLASFTGLNPGRYNIKIHESGDVSDECGNVGEEYSSLGASSFVADGEGVAVLLLQESSLSLEGPQSIMGRSVVISPHQDGGGSPLCGTIVRNVVKLADGDLL